MAQNDFFSTWEWGLHIPSDMIQLLALALSFNCLILDAACWCQATVKIRRKVHHCYQGHNHQDPRLFRKTSGAANTICPNCGCLYTTTIHACMDGWMGGYRKAYSHI